MIPLRHGPWPSINARDWLRGVWVWESTRVSAMLVSVLWIYRKMRKYRSTIVWCAGPGPRWLQSKHFDEQPWGRVRCLSDFSAGGCHVSTGIPQSLLAPDTVHIYIHTRMTLCFCASTLFPPKTVPKPQGLMHASVRCGGTPGTLPIHLLQSGAWRQRTSLEVAFAAWRLSPVASYSWVIPGCSPGVTFTFTHLGMVNIPPIKMVMTGGWFMIVLPTLEIWSAFLARLGIVFGRWGSRWRRKHCLWSLFLRTWPEGEAVAGDYIPIPHLGIIISSIKEPIPVTLGWPYPPKCYVVNMKWCKNQVIWGQSQLLFRFGQSPAEIQLSPLRQGPCISIDVEGASSLVAVNYARCVTGAFGAFGAFEQLVSIGNLHHCVVFAPQVSTKETDEI